MYQTLGSGPMVENCKEPDGEKQAAKAKHDLNIIRNFKESLFKFIKVVGIHNMGRERNSGSIQELLGTVEIDIMQREEAYGQILKKMEK